MSTARVPVVVSITIGQSPRIDLVPELQRILPCVEFVERGLLDGMTATAVDALGPTCDEEVLVTRLADGSSVRIRADWAHEEMARAVSEEARGDVAAVLVACSGTFPAVPAVEVPVFLPDRIFGDLVESLAEHAGALVLVTPDSEQKHAAELRFGRRANGAEVTAVSIDPYEGTEAEWDRLAESLASQARAADAPTVVALDCMGYTAEQAERLRLASGGVVVTVRSAVAEALADAIPPGEPPAMTRAGEEPSER